MIFDIWMKIAYIVQLMGACLIFMLPARKRSDFWFRVAGMAIILAPLSYMFDTIYPSLEFGILYFAYWAYYLVASIIFSWIGLDGNIMQAVYCGICACAVQHIAFDIYVIYQNLGGNSGIVMVLIYIVTYILFYLFFARRLPDKGEFEASKKAMFPIVTIVLLVWVLSVLEMGSVPGFESGHAHRVIYRIIDALCCFYVLWVQINQKEKVALQRELDGINNAWRQQTKQYQVTKDTIDSINRKCHDLKHQLQTLRNVTDEKVKQEYFDEIESEIMIYDTAVQTGNKALDVVLMEKGMFCKNHNIQWSCMADGSKLDFMKLEDIYAIFGNALDNAIAAVMELKDPGMKVISVKILTQSELLMIQIQNYYEHPLQFEDGIPVTTKRNKKEHGYGMKSIRYTAEKYNGTITVNAENNIFMLQILIPLEIPVIF